MEKDKVIMYDDPECARYLTDIKGWVNKDNKYYGEDEHLCRWSSCTHKVCKCGKPHEKMYTMCDDCRLKNEIERYEKREKKEWDGKAILYSDATQEYFADLDEAEEYCEECEPSCKLEDLRLRICDPTCAREIDPTDIYGDDFPEDIGIDNYPELEEAFEELNKKIREFNKKNVISWYPGQYALLIKE